jgi:hypothetical protein
MPALKHLHRYVLKKLGKMKVYACNKGNCTHYLNITMVENKMAECNRCGNPFVIGKQVFYGSHGRPMTKPHCPDCTKTRATKIDPTTIADYMGEKGDV